MHSPGARPDRRCDSHAPRLAGARDIAPSAHNVAAEVAAPHDAARWQAAPQTPGGARTRAPKVSCRIAFSFHLFSRPGRLCGLILVSPVADRDSADPRASLAAQWAKTQPELPTTHRTC